MCRTAQKGVHSTWVDNFSHTYHRMIQRVGLQEYNGNLWMGSGVHAAIMQMAFDLKRSADSAPAMPDNVFTDENFEYMKKKAGLATRQPTNRFDASISKNVRVVPLKPQLKRGDDPELFDRVNRTSNYSGRFHPIAIQDINIGSNAGLAQYMRLQYDKDMPLDANGERTPAKSYRLFVADVNIFHRVLKVRRLHLTPCVAAPYCACAPQLFYDRSGVAAPMKQYFSMTLGVWHPRKQASILLWRRFRPLLIGKLFHCLHPGSNCYRDAKLTQITFVLSAIRLAYPSIRDDLGKVIADVNRVSLQQRVAARNIQDMCEFFIPVVRRHVACSRASK